MIPGTSETHTEGFPYEIFRHRETKYFQRKIVILLCIKFFDTPNFLKHWRHAHEIFCHCETKNFRPKIVILPPPFPPPLVSIIFFDTRFFLIHRSERFPYEFFEHWDKKNFDTKSWDKSLKHKIFRYPKLVTHWRVPLRNFSALWDKHFLTENRDTPSSPPPSYP